MARYSVSDKNRYGFRDGLYQTMAWMVLAFIAVGLVTELLAGPLFYSLYREENTLGLGEEDWLIPFSAEKGTGREELLSAIFAGIEK